MVRGRKNVRDARIIVLGALKGIKAGLPRNFQRFKMNFDTVYMNTFLEKVLSSNLKIELYESAADKHSGKGKNSNTVSYAMEVLSSH